MFQVSVGSFLVLVSIVGHVASRQAVSVQLAGNNTETVQGKNGFCVCANFDLTMCPHSTTALTVCIHCFLAYLLSMKGNVDVVLSYVTFTSNQPLLHSSPCDSV
ncbi:hypothetical protein ILYODFUR_011447 [Ilyodon furcidens]|uniref:Uncharacterized protein n=1 Tax=Ilyodon furcidens TaxID=33524 RepID=A0ABV0VDS8_9TELE